MAADLNLTINGTPTPVYLGENTSLAAIYAAEAAADADAAEGFADAAADFAAESSGFTVVNAALPRLRNLYDPLRILVAGEDYTVGGGPGAVTLTDPTVSGVLLDALIDSETIYINGGTVDYFTVVGIPMRPAREFSCSEAVATSSGHPSGFYTDAAGDVVEVIADADGWSDDAQGVNAVTVPSTPEIAYLNCAFNLPKIRSPRLMICHGDELPGDPLTNSNARAQQYSVFAPFDQSRPHYGKRLGLITDSFGNPGYYKYQMIDSTGMILVDEVNETGSKLFDVPGGYFVGGNPGTPSTNPSDPFIPGVLEDLPLNELDVVIIQRLTNDTGSGSVPLGSYGNLPSAYTLYGKLELILQRAYLANPIIKIVFIGAAQRYDVSMTTPNGAGKTFVEYNAALRDFCQRKALTFVDWERNSGINDRNYGALLADALHPHPDHGPAMGRVAAGVINAAAL